MLTGEVNSAAEAAEATDMIATNINAAMEFLLMKFFMNVFI
jgi:hypothetical protein